MIRGLSGRGDRVIRLRIRRTEVFGRGGALAKIHIPSTVYFWSL